MKAVVISDSHKNFNSIIRIVDKEADAELFIHAGDVQQDIDDMESVWPDMAIEYVLGNNDYLVMNVPYQRVFKFGGRTIFLTHGHSYGVKYSLTELIKNAQKMGADICIFGHTHTPYLEQINGMWVLNPGSSWNSYGTIEIQNGNIDIKLKEN